MQQSLLQDCEGAPGAAGLSWDHLLDLYVQIFAECQTNHIQVIMAVAKGTGQHDKHCRQRNKSDLSGLRGKEILTAAEEAQRKTWRNNVILSNQYGHKEKD